MLFSKKKHSTNPVEPHSGDPVEMFTVRIHEAEEGGYWGEVLELPGCASQGETLDELKENILEAILACLEAHIEDEGPHVGKPVMTLSVPVSVPC